MDGRQTDTRTITAGMSLYDTDKELTAGKLAAALMDAADQLDKLGD